MPAKGTSELCPRAQLKVCGHSANSVVVPRNHQSQIIPHGPLTSILLVTVVRRDPFPQTVFIGGDFVVFSFLTYDFTEEERCLRSIVDKLCP